MANKNYQNTKNTKTALKCNQNIITYRGIITHIKLYEFLVSSFSFIVRTEPDKNTLFRGFAMRAE